MPRPGIQRRRWLLLPALLVIAVLAGCVGIPTSGSVQVGGLINDEDATDLEVLPDGPTPGSDPTTLLADFMQAVRSPASNFAIAQEFMTTELAAAWDPNAQTTIRRGPSEIALGSGTDLEYVFTSTAFVDERGRYTETPPSQQRLTYAFAQEDGEWRISAAPAGIVLTENSFDVVFRAETLYFFDPDYNYLVPDLRWVPVRATANDRVVRLLLEGPAEWLAQSVVSEFPDGTTLETDGVEVSSNSATIHLSVEAAQASELQLTRMREQLAATLGITTIVLSIGGGVGTSGATATATVNPQVDGSVLIGTGDGFGYSDGDGGVVPIPTLSSRIVTAGADAATIFAQRIAAFRADGIVYVTSTSTDTVPVDDRPGLLPPALDPYGFVWTVPSTSAAGIAVHGLDGAGGPVLNGLAADTRVVSMDVSRDGTRLLLSMVNGIGQPELLVAGIIRGEDNVPVSVGSSLPLLLTANPVDAAWVDDSRVVVLTGADDATTAIEFQVGGPSTSLGSVPGAVQVVGGNGGGEGIRRARRGGRRAADPRSQLAVDRDHRHVPRRAAGPRPVTFPQAERDSARATTALCQREPMLPASLLDAIAVLVPVECAGCGVDDRAVCQECMTYLQAAVTPRPVDDVVVYTALRYEAVARRVLLALKEQGRTDTGKALAVPMAAALERALTDRDAELALVPPSRAAWRRRGYDPVRLLLRRAGRKPPRILAHAGGGSRQKDLGSADRAVNLTGAFVALGRLDGRRFVIVDDVLTSGATIREAVRAIRAAGGEVVAGAALAFTPRSAVPLYAARDIRMSEE